MALSDKNILITPNRGQAADPKIEFSGADASVGPQTIALNVYPANNGTISFEGTAGQLFSITNSLSGTIFSVNDVSGIPSLEILDTGVVRIGQFPGNVLVGTSIDNGQKFQVSGNISATAFIGDGSQLTGVTTIPVYTYDNRGNLRSTTPTDNDKAIVEGLGLFVFETGSDEPDDDETCFATATGKWLLETPSGDYADEILSMEAQSRVLYGQAVCPLASVVADVTTSFTAEVLGVTPGDNVLVAPPLALTTSANVASIYAAVTDIDTVTVYVSNAGAGTWTIPQEVRNNPWPLTVFKGY
jgi:hypothetical protein